MGNNCAELSFFKLLLQISFSIFLLQKMIWETIVPNYKCIIVCSKFFPKIILRYTSSDYFAESSIIL